MLNRDAYESAFARFSETLPAATIAPRRAALQRFLDTGLPGKGLEAWKYTDLSPLGAEAVAAPSVRGRPETPLPQFPSLHTRCWVNGRAPDGDAPADPVETPSGEHAHDGLADLNAAFALPGIDLRLGDGASLDTPLHALFVTEPQGDGEMVHLRHRIVLGEGASATVVVHELGRGDAPRWSTHLLDIELARSARLRLVRLQDESAGTRGWFEARAAVHGDASLDVTQVDLGGGIVRNDWRPRLLAPGADVVLRGLMAPVGRTHVDSQFLTEHAAAHGRSRQWFRGLAWDRAQGIFNGKVVVRPGAQKTDSEQRIANLLLSPRARINAKPELEIYADDVKCAHGATFGRLDPAALFYLRSRGVDEATARALLIHGFAEAVLQHLEPAELRKAVVARLLERIGNEIDPEVLA